MQRFKYTLLLLLISIVGFAQNANYIAYVEKYKEIAILEMYEHKIPASITLAQGILESAAGKSKLATEANNHFGIKCHRDWDGSKVYHDDDKDNECFRKYKHAEESYKDHSLFLVNRSRYQDLFKLKMTDYKGWAKGLKKAGYATNKRYPQLLINLIESYELHQYDLVKKDEVDELDEDMFVLTPDILVHKNNIKYIVVEVNETLESISTKMEVSVKRLLKYNDLDYDDTITQGQILYIQPKRSKAKEKFYTVKAGDTMYSISQKQGIKLKCLYKRNRVPVGYQPKAGTQLVLRGYKKK